MSAVTAISDRKKVEWLSKHCFSCDTKEKPPSVETQIIE